MLKKYQEPTIHVTVLQLTDVLEASGGELNPTDENFVAWSWDSTGGINI